VSYSDFNFNTRAVKQNFTHSGLTDNEMRNIQRDAPMKQLTIPLIIVITSLLWLPSATADEARPWEIDDVYRAESFSSVAVAPNGEFGVAVRNWIDPKTKLQRHSLWFSAGDPLRSQPMEAGEPDARAPLISPDGKWIAFLSTRPRPKGWEQTPQAPVYSEPTVDIWLISIRDSFNGKPKASADQHRRLRLAVKQPSSETGYQAVPLAGSEKSYGRVYPDQSIGRVAFSPDGRKLLFIADDGDDGRSDSEIEANVTVVREDQGEGYEGFGPGDVWVAELAENPDDHAAARIVRLTDDEFWYGQPQWSPDGDRIAVHANRTAERESIRYSMNQNYDIWEIEVATRAIPQLTDGPGPEFFPRYSPDGSRLSYLTSPRHRGPHFDVYNFAVVTTEEKPQSRVVFDFRAADVDYRAVGNPGSRPHADCWEDESHIVYDGYSGLNSKRLLLNVDTGEITESGVADTKFSKRRELESRFRPRGKPAPPKLNAKSERVEWDNGEGMKIDGALITPHPDIAKPPYKLIVNPHGGPHWRASLGAGFNDQVLASRGYAIFKPNFRGSLGYGLRFLDSNRGDLGGGDMRDILSGVDHLVKAGVADEDQLYVYGVSYGGYMTSWLVGQTDRFKAAVAENAVTDLTMMWTLSDLQSWTEWSFGGKPWEVPNAMRQHSPLTHAGKVTTPTLILHSANDRQCPLPMGQAFHQALLRVGVQTQLVIYPNERHSIVQPRHRADKLRRILSWFEENRQEDRGAK
jgi:dipeptidyl aminopeptidase/acylaminoacyl peptidase